MSLDRLSQEALEGAAGAAGGDPAPLSSPRSGDFFDGDLDDDDDDYYGEEGGGRGGGVGAHVGSRSMPRSSSSLGYRAYPPSLASAKTAPVVLVGGAARGNGGGGGAMGGSGGSRPQSAATTGRLRGPGRAPPSKARRGGCGPLTPRIRMPA